MRQALEATLSDLAGGLAEWPFETLRTAARQTYLYGFGRQYDDGRGIVTRSPTIVDSWHSYGLAVDVVEKSATPWDAPASFWLELGKAGEAHGLFWGGRFHHPDLPHLQWTFCPLSPALIDGQLLLDKGAPAVWAKYGAG